MTRTFDTERVSTPFPQRLIISALTVGAVLLGLSAPVLNAAPNDGPGTEPGPHTSPAARSLR